MRPANSGAVREGGDERIRALLTWVRDDLGMRVRAWEPVTGDASTRRYFRVWTAAGPWIAMDAPAPEDPGRFVAVAGLLRGAGIRVPVIRAQWIEGGFLLLEDFGDRTYFRALDRTRVDRLYADALAALNRLQTRIDPLHSGLPTYDEVLLRRELEIFREWLLERWLQVEIPAGLWSSTAGLLVASALEQPRVCVHRDFHSRNLMVLSRSGPGVLDFQDAVIGPVTYDVVSLLRDCYLAWPGRRVDRWREDYRRRLAAAGPGIPPRQWRRWFDRMGVQRHLKAAGIFARLWLRDGRPGYLGDIPRTLGYVVAVACEDAGLREMGDFLARRVLPRLTAAPPGR